VGGRWMDVYGVIVEWHWQEKTEVLGEKAVPLSHVNQKSHTIWPRIEPGTPPCSMAAVYIIISHVTHFVSTLCLNTLSRYFAFAVVQLKSSQYVAMPRGGTL
jgi:hypothetical protein